MMMNYYLGSKSAWWNVRWCFDMIKNDGLSDINKMELVLIIKNLLKKVILGERSEVHKAAVVGDTLEI